MINKNKENNIMEELLTSNLNNTKKFNILLIQDNIGDIVLTQRIFKRIEAKIQLQYIKNGLQAYELFSNQNKKLDVIPHLILLDLNLPGMNGLQILKVIKNHSLYKFIPVIILTTSKRDIQIKLAYENNANTYISKPIQIDKFQQLLRSINDYWSKFANIHLIGQQ